MILSIILINSVNNNRKEKLEMTVKASEVLFNSEASVAPLGIIALEVL